MKKEEIKITNLSLSSIIPSSLNPRKHFDQASIDELAESIRQSGVLQPILVRLHKPGVYMIVAGERRYRAAAIADLKYIPCIIRAITEEEALDIMIVENLQRKDIHPIEEANGFRQLSEIKHLDIKEIAARVGKSASYVAQRLQLTHLVDQIQQHFFHGHVLVKDALTLATLSAEDQQEIYDELMDGTGRPFELDNWTLRKFRHKLTDAPFDIADATLLPLAGACTSCVFNSACQQLLFPDMVGDPLCSRPSCYHQKTETAFSQEIVKAAEDPSVILISNEYQPEKATKELMKKYDQILTKAQFSEIDTPDRPDRESFEGDNETELEDEQDYQRALKSYEDDLKDFQSKIARGGYIKAFQIGGHDKGKYTWIKLNKKTTATTSNGSSAKEAISQSDQDIKDEIQRIKDREKRAIVLDDVKIWDQVKALFKPIDAIKDFTDHNLTQIELTAAAYAIYNKLTFQTRDKLESYYTSTKDKKVKTADALDNYFSEITQFGVNELLRIFFLDTLPPTAIYGEIQGDAAVMMKVAEAYWPNAVEQIGVAQSHTALTRASRVATKIKSLQARLKPATKAPTARPAKGKGIKALIEP